MTWFCEFFFHCGSLIRKLSSLSYRTKDLRVSNTNAANYDNFIFLLFENSFVKTSLKGNQGKYCSEY